MELTYHGHSCMRLRGRDVTVFIDPPQAPLPGLARSAAGLVVRTDGATDTDRLRPREGEVQEVAGPGEFEVAGVSIFGLPAGETTVMRVALDDVRVLAAGRLRRQLTEEEIDALGHVDVLVVPVGGGDALGAVEAAKLVNALEPGIVVPARFGSSAGGEFETIDRFAREMGLAEGTWQPQPRLMLNGPTGDGDETRVVILELRTG